MNIVFSAVVMTPASKHTYLLIMNAILHVYMYVVSWNVLVPCRQPSGTAVFILAHTWICHLTSLPGLYSAFDTCFWLAPFSLEGKFELN